MIKVVFVCLGNICRSPLAEAIFKNKVLGRGIHDSFEAHSCGTANYHVGDSPDPRTIRNAKKNGVLIEHVGRQLCEEDIAYFDYIFVMDKSNYSNVLRLENAKQNEHKVHMLRTFDTIKGDEVPDPYYGQEKDFQEVFEILDRSVEGAIHFLLQRP
ncbi:MAG TPA: low molecular weight protein-tyrosine-phosphatase [Cyclobacteriaceae bacterium]|jgi:protein-tyrosine phosphatase|nr:low molecular weight protein-tyrosine-phosphatase [Cyclobacteriaceae bacterium]